LRLSLFHTVLFAGEASDADVDLAEWLARRGAKNIVMCNPPLYNCPQYRKKVQALKLRRNVNIQSYDVATFKKTLAQNNADAVFFVNLVNISFIIYYCCFWTRTVRVGSLRKHCNQFLAYRKRYFLIMLMLFSLVSISFILLVPRVRLLVIL